MLTLLIVLAVLAGIAALCLFLVAVAIAGGQAWLDSSESQKTLDEWLREAEQ